MAFRTRRSYAHYSANGRRVDDVVMPAGVCQFQPGSGDLVALRYNDVRLVDPAGKVLRTIDRRPDGNWLEQPQAIALAPDGFFAIWPAGRANAAYRPISTRRAARRSTQSPCPRTLDRFRGSPTTASGWSSPATTRFSSSTAQASWLRVAIILKVPQGMFYYPYFLPGGRELALFDGKRPVLHRYELP